jgi:hypothetical protein
MDVNFKEALTVIYRALPVVLFRAGIFAAGGFMIIVIFGMLLFAFRVAGGAGSVVGIAVAVSALLGLAVSGLILQPGRHAAPVFRARPPGSRSGIGHS